MLFVDDIQVGDIYRVKDEAETGIRSKRVRIESISPGGDSGGCRCVDDGIEWCWYIGWILDGKLRLESKMSIVFEEDKPETAEEKAPSWGEREVLTLKDLISDSAMYPSGNKRDAMRDCINTRYRTKAYRDYIKEMESKGLISMDQINEMSIYLRGIRHSRRTPQAKAFRHQWP